MSLYGRVMTTHDETQVASQAPSLEAALRVRFQRILGGTLQPIVINHLASEAAAATGDWLRKRAHDEVYDSDGYRCLELAAEESGSRA